MARPKVNLVNAVLFFAVSDEHKTIIRPNAVLRILGSVLHLVPHSRPVRCLELTRQNARLNLVLNSFPRLPYLNLFAQGPAWLLHAPYQRARIEPVCLASPLRPLGQIVLQRMVPVCVG